METRDAFLLLNDNNNSNNNNTQVVVDFSSNDYLGLASNVDQHQKVQERYYQHQQQQLQLVQVQNHEGQQQQRRRRHRQYNQESSSSFTTTTMKPHPPHHHHPLPPWMLLGSTGSRLLSGDTQYCHALERYLAKIHNRSVTLLCNSGYDANLSLISTLPCTILLYDEYCHNSIHMGIRLWLSSTSSASSSSASSSSASSQKRAMSFQHNNVLDLKRQLQTLYNDHDCHTRSLSLLQQQLPLQVMIVVESVYSMDGDVAPLTTILDLALEYHAHVVVDEAHGLGVYGRHRRQQQQPHNQDNDEYHHFNPESVSSEFLFQQILDEMNDENNNNNNAKQQQSLSSSQQQQQHNLLLVPGTGVLAEMELEHHPALFATVYTFGKAVGCHGAILCANHKAIQEYWINFAYPIIYSTCLPYHSLVTIQVAYETMTSTTTTTTPVTTRTTRRIGGTTTNPVTTTNTDTHSSSMPSSLSSLSSLSFPYFAHDQQEQQQQQQQHPRIQLQYNIHLFRQMLLPALEQLKSYCRQQRRQQQYQHHQQQDSISNNNDKNNGDDNDDDDDDNDPTCWLSSCFVMSSDSCPIQALRIIGNEACTLFCHDLYQRSNCTIRLYPIKSPTIPIGQERIRIIVHANNTILQIQFLVQLIIQTLYNQQEQEQQQMKRIKQQTIPKTRRRSNSTRRASNLEEEEGIKRTVGSFSSSSSLRSKL